MKLIYSRLFPLLVGGIIVFGAFVSCKNRDHKNAGVNLLSTDSDEAEFMRILNSSTLNLKLDTKTVVIFSSNFGCSPCSVRETSLLDTMRVFKNFTKFFVYSGMNTKEVKFLDNTTDTFAFTEFVPNLLDANDVALLQMIEDNGTFVVIYTEGTGTFFIPEKSSLEKSLLFYKSIL